MKIYEKSRFFTIFQRSVGNLGVDPDHPPKMCAGLPVHTQREVLRVQAMPTDRKITSLQNLATNHSSGTVGRTGEKKNSLK